MFTPLQDNLYNMFMSSIEKGKSLIILSSDIDRGAGKTYVIQKLGFMLQVDGYKVVVISPSQTIEYYADKWINVVRDELGKRDDLTDCVVLLDEAELDKDLDNFIDMCSTLDVPVVGFAR